MKSISYVTTNSSKVRSLERELVPLGIKIVQVPLDLSEPRSSDVDEIAKAKIEEAYGKVGGPVVVLDAGFYIDALNGFPRAFVNFALETIDLRGMIKLLKGETNRKCEFRECLAFMSNELSEPVFIRARIPGTIAEEERGSLGSFHWSRLSLIFIPDGYEKNLAEFSEAEYVPWHNKKESTSRGFAEWIKSTYSLKQDGQR